MLLALLALAFVALVLAAPLLYRRAGAWSAERARRRPTAPNDLEALYDPGRERRAEQRARELLRSCVNEEEWGMYRDLGFIRVGGRLFREKARGGGAAVAPARAAAATDEPPYAYLISPQKPIVAYVPKTGRL